MSYWQGDDPRPPTDLEKCTALLVEVTRERDRLHRVVATYGDHLEECAVAESEGEARCDCGWIEACIRSFEFAGQEYLDLVDLEGDDDD